MRLALFDLDLTLLPLDSDHAFGEFLIRLGWVDEAAYRARNDAFYADYQAGRLDMDAYVDFATAAWRSRSPAEQHELSARFVREVIEPAIRPPAVELVQHHRERGDRVVMVTATNEFITRPIARRFGIDTLIATALERDADGRLTGRIAGRANLREGKLHNVASWLTGQGLSWGDLESSTCYSDSTNDLPLLERVSHPVATNPAAELERIARERGWPILRLFT